jgi:hypothetical protein
LLPTGQRNRRFLADVSSVFPNGQELCSAYQSTVWLGLDLIRNAVYLRCTPIREICPFWRFWRPYKSVSYALSMGLRGSNPTRASNPSDREINFRTVASEAKVSTAWLYGQEELRVRILCSRKRTCHMGSPASASQDRERLSRQNIVATLRLRIKALEEKNRELTTLLELAYGKLALAREKNASIWSGFLNDSLERSAELLVAG